MNTPGTVARNVLWNWAGMAIPMLAGFVVAPFLVHRLGETEYGLWILVLSLTGYFNLFDLGVCGSVGRNMAFHRARGDREQINATLSTALAFLVGVAGLVVLATLAVSVLFFDLFAVPEDQAEEVRLALLVVGAGMAVSLPLSAFDAALWSMQRFDVINKIEVPAALLRTGLAFAAVLAGWGLVALAAVSALVAVLTLAVKGVWTFRLDAELALRWDQVGGPAARGLFGFGVWSFLLSLSRMVTERVGALVIGARLGARFVTPQSIAAKLTGYASGLMVAGSEVLTPVATALHADEDHERQKRLFVEGGKYCAALALFFVVFFLLLGWPFLALWVNPKLADWAALPLVILALGELLPMTQQCTYGLILGASRHRTLAMLCLMENAAAIAMALLLVGPYGLVGVCVGLAVPATICRGVGQLVYACQLFGVSLWRYLAWALLPAAAVAALPALSLLLLTRWRVPATWAELLAFAAVYTLCYLVAASVVLLGCRRAASRGVEVTRFVLGLRWQKPGPERPGRTGRGEDGQSVADAGGTGRGG